MTAFTESRGVVTFNNFLKRVFFFVLDKMVNLFLPKYSQVWRQAFLFFPVSYANQEALDTRKFVSNIIWNKSESVNKWITKRKKVCKRNWINSDMHALENCCLKDSRIYSYPVYGGYSLCFISSLFVCVSKKNMHLS